MRKSETLQEVGKESYRILCCHVTKVEGSGSVLESTKMEGYVYVEKESGIKFKCFFEVKDFLLRKIILFLFASRILLFTRGNDTEMRITGIIMTCRGGGAELHSETSSTYY